MLSGNDSGPVLTTPLTAATKYDVAASHRNINDLMANVLSSQVSPFTSSVSSFHGRTPIHSVAVFVYGPPRMFNSALTACRRGRVMSDRCRPTAFREIAKDGAVISRNQMAITGLSTIVPYG